MAVQIPDPGTGNGQTGDNEYVFRKKVRDNFSDQNNAASREVGTSNGNVVEMTSTGIASKGYGGLAPANSNAGPDFNNHTAAGIYTMAISGAQNSPQTSITGLMHVSNRYFTAGTSILQDLIVDSDGKRFMRVGSGGTNDSPSNWSQWGRMVVQSNNDIYQLTTASGANVTIDSAGYLRRSTSSERYKDIIADLELDDAAYANAMQLAPIVYRSTADADNPAYHYYSFSAEALGAYDPAFTLWRDTETVTDNEGNVTQQPLDERVAEGININALLAFSHAIAIKQDKMIKAQAEAIETLTKRIDAMTAQ